jgi:glutathionylspermidine synthase
MGSRKIMKSQVDRVITSETLSHMAEEIRHAQVLKILALKFSQQQLSTYHDEHLLCGGEAKAYIQTVDRAAEAALQHASLQKITHSNELNYLFTTLLVEERAAQLYPLYNEVLGNLGHPNKLQGIVREEQQHLDTVTAHLKTYCIHDQLPALRQIEIEAFDRWQQAILQRLASC